MRDVIQVSYTGDLLAHRRCPRAWLYQKYAGFHPYEQIQAMEGRLIHHAMEWLAKYYRDLSHPGQHATRSQLKEQLERHFRVLWSRGVRTAFVSKQETIDRILGNLCDGDELCDTVKSVIEGAQHTEYELRAVRKVLPEKFEGKSKILLTGVLDVVVQQSNPLTYHQVWNWTSREHLKGQPISGNITARPNDVEIWDYKGTRLKTTYLEDYVRQVLTYAALYREKTGQLPVRCVLFFVNEKAYNERLLCVEVDEDLVEIALNWTYDQVKALRSSVKKFEVNPQDADAGEYERRDEPPEKRISEDLAKQCTTCGFRFDCPSYTAYLQHGDKTDIDKYTVYKN